MITVLTGENNFMLRAELRRRIDAFTLEHGDMALERFDGEEAEFDRMRESLQSLPFLASKKLVVLRRPSANKQFTEAAEALLSDLSEVTDVIIVEPKPDKRTGYYKFLKKHGDMKTFDELDAPKTASWLVQQAKAHGGSLKQADAMYLVSRVGINQQLLFGELQKLLTYAPDITRQTIDMLTEQTPQSTTFDLLDAALSGKTGRALELYTEQRAMKVEPQLIMGTLAWQLHILALVKAAGNMDASEIASRAKLNPYPVRKTQGLARQMSGAAVKDLVHRVRLLDQRMKSESIDADEALKNLIISLK